MTEVNTYIVLIGAEDDRLSAETIRLNGVRITDATTPNAAAEYCVAACNYGKADTPFYVWVLYPSGDVCRFIVYVSLAYCAEPDPFNE